MNFIVETKKEYTINLINIITPFLYEGFNSIYDEAIKNSPRKEELKYFQKCLQCIPLWKDEIIKLECKRIMLESSCSDILEDLLNAVVKANIIVLSNVTPDSKNHTHINFTVDFNKFIHHSYIEAARSIFQNPFLFLRNVTDNEKSRNRKETLEIIKIAIEETIRKMIPLDLVLKKYLGKTFDDNKINIDPITEESITIRDKNTLIHLLKTDDINKKEIVFNDKNDLMSESYIPPNIKIFDSYDAKNNSICHEINYT